MPFDVYAYMFDMCTDKVTYLLTYLLTCIDKVFFVAAFKMRSRTCCSLSLRIIRDGWILKEVAALEQNGSRPRVVEKREYKHLCGGEGM